MAYKEWYYNVPKQIIQGGDEPGSHSYQTEANFRAYTTVGHSDPGMAAAIVNSQIPAPMLDRMVAAYTQQQAPAQAQHLQNQGIEPNSAMSDQSAAALAQRQQVEQQRQQQQQDASSQGNWLSGIGHAIGQGVNAVGGALSSIPGVYVQAGKDLVSGGEKVANAVESLIETPLAAGKSSGTTAAEQWSAQAQRERALAQKAGLPAGPMGSNDAVSNVLNTYGSNVVDYVKGWANILTGHVSPGQQQDMRQRGFDPTNPLSIYHWYYNDWTHGGFPTVPDQNVQRAIDSGSTPQDANSARELVVSGMANDPSGLSRKALTPQAQDFAARLTANGANSPEARTFNIIQDQNSMHFGGSFADSVGLKAPSTARDVVTALADLVGTWEVDPLGHVGDLYKAGRAALYGVQADKLGQVARVMASSDKVTSAPTNGPGKMMNDLLQKTDDVFLHTQAGNAAMAAGDTTQAAQHFATAANITDQFRRTKPGLMNTWDAMLQLRSGAVQDFVPKNLEQVKAESAAAEQYGRNPSWIQPVIDNSRTPAWALRSSLDEALTPAETLTRLAPIRKQVAEALEPVILQEAMATGRPMFRNKILLPGDTTVAQGVRQAMQPIMSAITDQSQRLTDVLDHVASEPKLNVPVENFAGGPEAFDAATGSWATTLQPKDRGLAAAFGRMQNMMEMSASGRILNFYSGDGTETLRRLALQSGMPRTQAYALINQWSMGTAGERQALWRELATSMVEAGGLRDTAAKRAAVEFATKGTVSFLDNATKQAVEDTSATWEKYAAGDRNLINVEGRPVAAGLLPSQMADGVRIPSNQDIKRLVGRTNVLNRAAGFGKDLFTDTTGYKWLSTLTTAWKSNVVSTFSNPERQIGEAATFLANTDPAVLARTVAARHTQALDTAEQRLLQNQAIAGSRKIIDAASPDDIAELEKLQRTDPNGFRTHLTSLGTQAGLNPAQARAMAIVGETANLGELAGMSKSGLWLAGPLDLLRQARIGVNETLGTRDLARNSAAWHDWTTKEAIDRITSGALDELKTSASHRVLTAGSEITGADTTMAGAVKDIERYVSRNKDSADEIAAGAAKGVQLKFPNMRPNAWTEVPTTGEVGAHKWSQMIDQWAHDEIGGDVLRRIAFDNTIAPGLAKKAKGGSFDAGRAYSDLRAKEELQNDPQLVQLRSDQTNAMAADPHGMPDPNITQAIAARQKALLQQGWYQGSTIHEMVDDLLSRNEKMQQFSQRMNHDADGRAIAPNDTAGLAAAREKTAQDIVAEARHMLGIKTSPVDGADIIHDSLKPMLDKIWNQQAVTGNELREVPEEIRPPMARTPSYIPDLGTKDPSKIRQAIARGAAIQYDTFVGRPMTKMWANPQFQAQMWRAYKLLGPVADDLIEKGMTPEAAGIMLEHNAAQYAVAAVHRNIDDPAEHTVFTEMANQHLMFIRATEDFFVRLGRAYNVNPGRMMRAWLPVEAAINSGAIYQQPGYGSTQSSQPGQAPTPAPKEWMFTYPGTALANRLLAEGLQSMGWGDAGVRVPVFSGWNAPVTYLNPGFGNPIGHSANPMFALPLRALRDYVFPNAWAPSINPEITALEGGEDGFAQKSMLRSILPTWADRVIDGLNWSDSNAKLMSAAKWALQTATAAGIMPGENASPDEYEQATHSIRQLAINNLVLRMIGALFLPASPSDENMQTPQTPQVDPEAMRNGLRSIRNDWFAVLEGAAQQYGAQAALGKAHEEWARRYPEGQSLLNPDAYTVGTYKLANPDPNAPEKSIPRTQDMVNWANANMGLFDRYKPLFPLLLPAVGQGYFNTTANQNLFNEGILKQKSMAEFAKDVRTAQTISDFFTKESEYKAALANATSDQQKTSINNDWYDFSARWTQAHPISQEKMSASSAPDYIHGTLAPSVGAFLHDDHLPPEMNALKPAVAELYNDYQTYRTDYLQAKPQNRYNLNKDYWALGDSKWTGTDMNDLWRAFRVYEGRN